MFFLVEIHLKTINFSNRTLLQGDCWGEFQNLVIRQSFPEVPHYIKYRNKACWWILTYLSIDSFISDTFSRASMPPGNAASSFDEYHVSLVAPQVRASLVTWPQPKTRGRVTRLGQSRLPRNTPQSRIR